MRIYKLYGVVTTTANNIASIQLVRSGKIKGIQAAAYVDSNTDNAQLIVEASLVPVNQIAVNDTQGQLCELRWAGNFVTSGLSSEGINEFLPMDVPVQAGEKVYLNAQVGGTVSAGVTLFIHVQD